MTRPFEDDGSAHFAHEVDQWDPSLDLFHFVSDRNSPLGDLCYEDYENIQQAPSPSLSPGALATAVPAAGDLPTPSSFGHFPDTAEGYDHFSSTGDDETVEAPVIKQVDGEYNIASPMMSSAEDENESIHSQDKGDWPTSHGRVSTAVRSSRASSNLFRCGWERCEYSGGFSGVGALLRHIKTKHICPGVFKCPDESCFKTFNRKDNLIAHTRNVHRV